MDYTFYSIGEGALKDIPVLDGNVIYIRETNKIFVDICSWRNAYLDVTFVSSDRKRRKMKNLKKGYYLVQDRCTLYKYTGERWLAITQFPKKFIIFLDDDMMPKNKERI